MVSVCIFGSTARNRFDSLSDRDVLIVASSDADLAETSRDWSSAGWSISRFTHEQMMGMAARGSVFLQHIKQEGHIVRDDEGFLAAVIDTFRPKQNYDDELFDSWALLDDISRRPLAYWPALCSADIAFGSVRNIAVLSLASQGKYIFDYYDLIDHFANEHHVSSVRLEALHHLRTLKHGYRNRLTTLVPWHVLSNALLGVKDLFGPRTPRRAKNDSSGYRRLRMLELDLVTRADPRYWDQLPADDPLAGAWAHIRDPRGYPKDKLVDAAWIRRIRLLAENRFASERVGQISEAQSVVHRR
jgi:hypothetical protein